MISLLPVFMFVVICLVLMAGYPVAFTLAGVSLLFAGLGILLNIFDANLLLAYPDRVYGIMTNSTLIAVPLFVFMGVILERSKMAEELLENMAQACGRLPAGLGISVVVVGMLMAASTGIVGATVVTMGLMSLPTMLKRGYDTGLATGTICATGTLGQIIPPSIALVLLGDVLSSAYQQAQLNQGIFNAAPVSVGDLFVGAMIPGLLLVVFYILYLLAVGLLKPHQAPAIAGDVAVPSGKLVASILPPIVLILLVLGSIISGQATPTEASGVGAGAAIVLALIKKQLSWKKMAATPEMRSVEPMRLVSKSNPPWIHSAATRVTPRLWSESESHRLSAEIDERHSRLRNKGNACTTLNISVFRPNSGSS